MTDTRGVPPTAGGAGIDGLEPPGRFGASPAAASATVGGHPQRPLRVLMVLNSPNWSGASSYCIELSRGLAQRGHRVLILSEPGEPCRRARAAGLICDDGIRLNHRNPVLYADAICRLARSLRRFRPDVVSSHINEGAWMAGWLARRVAPAATVVRARCDIDPPKGHAINRWVHHRWTDHLIVASEMHRRICHDVLRVPLDRIDVAYAAVDVARFRPDPAARARVRAELGLSDDEWAVGVVGRLDPVKGHEFAIGGIAGLPPDLRHRARLVVVGKAVNRDRTWLQQQAAAAGIAGRVLAIDHRDDVPDLINALDLGLIASVGSEAVCRVALEFAASAVPVLATRVGVIPELFPEAGQAVMVEPRSAAALTAALAALLPDADARQRMGLAGFRRVTGTFTHDRLVAATEGIYRRAIARRRSVGEASA